MRLVIAVVVMLIVSGIVVAGFSNIADTSQTNLSANLVDVTSDNTDTSVFERANAVRPIIFPDDLGPHPTFQTEWWYYTGNLADDAGQRYGFQLTFFRRALAAEMAERSSEWANNQLYFAHFTITDAANDAFYVHERFSRGGANLAGAQSVPYRVWLENWEVASDASGTVHLKAQDGDVALDLTLESLKPPALQGDRGFSPKSDEPGNASYYYSMTRQKATGTVSTPNGSATVSGFAWKDHEWSTSALGPNSLGWDWFSFQLDDNREVMFFQIRNEDGSLDPVSDGIIVYADGSTRHLTKNEVQIEVLDHWESSYSQVEYPAKWTFKVPSEKIDLTVTPLVADQELPVIFTYWEGAVRIEGSQQGYGYIEMTGYAESMQGQF